MAKWDIEPAGVRGVVSRTQAAGQGFEKAGRLYASGARNAAGSAGSPIVTLALQSFAKHHRTTLTGLVDKTVASLTAAVGATNAYLDGDLEMAERAQRHGATVNGVHKQMPRR